MPAVLTLLRQDKPNLIDSVSGRQWPMRAPMTGLSTHLPPAFLQPAPLSRFTCQPIGGRWLGGVRGVLFAQRQLPLQMGDLLLSIRDLLLGIRDLLLLLGNLFGLTADLLVPFGQLPAQALVLSFQVSCVN